MWSFIKRSLWFHRRIHAAVALGVMTATAVLTGALLVGDSVRGSLRDMALDRLGGIDYVLIAPRFFRAKLADNLNESRDVEEPQMEILAAPAIILKGSASTSANSESRTAGNTSIYAVDERLAAVAGWGFKHEARARQIVVPNRALWRKLQPGSSIVIRLPKPSEIPAESALGRKTDTIQTLPALKYEGELAGTGFADFSVNFSQQFPYNAFVPLATVQNALDQPDGANAIFVRFNRDRRRYDEDYAPSPADDDMLRAALKPTLNDYGLTLASIDDRYFNFSSDRMLLDEPTDTAAEAAFALLDGQATFTYLANEISAGDAKAKIPYSTITALDLRTEPPLGPFVDADGKAIQPLADDEIVLDRWAADDMAKQGVKLKPGDMIAMRFFQPNDLHGEGKESTAQFRLKAICEMSGAAVDRHLVPELKGVTDRKSIANWNPPLKFDPKAVRKIDEDYWAKYRATPKAFVSLAAGRKLWASRFGRTTSWRIPARPGMTVQSLTDRLKLDPAKMGFQFLPIRRMALEAAKGTTSFNELFLYFSFFIIAAAVMLVALLFRLGIDGRAVEIGTLAAIGFSRRQIRRLLLAEGLVISLIGAALGVACGLAYAWLMLVGLRTWWLAAITTPFLQLHVAAESLAIGFIAGVLVSLATIAWSLRQQSKLSARQLLAGQSQSSPGLAALGPRRLTISRAVAALSLATAIALIALLARKTSGEAQAGVFFGSGFLVLTALLAFIWDRLRTGSSTVAAAAHGTLWRLSIRNAARRPLRSVLTIGLMAMASFLIVSVSAFRLTQPSESGELHSGDGGFSLFAETDQPIYQDMTTAEGRKDLELDVEEGENPVRSRSAKLLDAAEIVSLRVAAGDNASCLNLYQPRQPRLVGVSPTLVAHVGFEWSSTAAATDAERKNPWLLCANSPFSPRPTAGGNTAGTDTIPCIMDEATASYSLHLDGVGSTYRITAADGSEATLRVVGLLKNSIFQGDVLIPEAALMRLFPDAGGYRLFLIDAKSRSAAERQQLQSFLEANLSDYGFSAETTAHRLESFMAVQNTYLSTFQSLGGLGLLLGTIGLAVVQLRSVLERRGELALMRAVGFRRRRLASLVTLENAALLLGGLLTGTIAAAIAIAPQLFGGGASAPWLTLTGTLALVLAVGLTAGLLAVRATVRAPHWCQRCATSRVSRDAKSARSGAALNTCNALRSADFASRLTRRGPVRQTGPTPMHYRLVGVSC